MLRPVVWLSSALIVVGATAVAQPYGWTQLNVPGPLPAQRHSVGLAYDAARGVTVLFGGLNGVKESGTGVLGDTWEFDGTSWTQKFPAHSPTARQGMAMAYDSVRGEVVLFGGKALAPDPVYPTDTWRWDGDDWTLASSTSPDGGGRVKAGIAFDPGRGVMVLFGGYRGGAAYASTWEWNGSAWTDVTPSSGNPAARSRVALSFDPVTHRVLLFGGRSAGGANLDDTWDWNGSAWTFLNAAGAAVARSRHEMVYDPVRDLTVTYGGQPFSQRTAEWDRVSWTESTHDPEPETRFYHGMTYHATLNATLLFGGTDAASVYNDVWVYAPIGGGGNHPPVAVNDAYQTSVDTALVVPAPGVLGNDFDADQDPLTAAKTSDPSNGSVAFAPNGGFTYTPNPGFSGMDSFTYVASDGLATSGAATVTITVSGGGGGGNLLANAAFDADLSGWSFTSGAWQHDAVTFHDASGSVGIAQSSNGDHLFTQTVAATAGTHYDASVYVKTQNVTGNGRFAELRVVWLDGSGAALQTLDSADVTGTSDWTLVSLSNAAAPAQTQSARFELRLRAATGALAWFDDCSFSAQ